ncbi:hypothetical protein NOS3756_08570 [Nostoc sp. NIES-3756]|nr:hypothetical protein NOS3756_08570 [Nostoc sp. NIES-3756]BAY40361.1 hypothetical protein NIES2111_47440 [Nostoc sp. NIES-2111]
MTLELLQGFKVEDAVTKQSITGCSEALFVENLH